MAAAAGVAAAQPPQAPSIGGGGEDAMGLSPHASQQLAPSSRGSKRGAPLPLDANKLSVPCLRRMGSNSSGSRTSPLGGPGGLRKLPSSLSHRASGGSTGPRSPPRAAAPSLSVLEKFELLLKPIEARRNLTASLVQNKSNLSGRLDVFKEAKAQFERVVRGDEHRPIQVVLSDPVTPPKVIPSFGDDENPLCERPAKAGRRRRRSQPVEDPAPEQTTDATNLCMVFKAFQPCLEHNLPPQPETDECIDAILHPTGGDTYKRFIVNKQRPTSQGRARRRQLLRRQHAYGDVDDDGGVPWSTVRVKGHNGEITPGCFKMVLTRLTEGRLNPALILTLYDWLDTHGKVSTQGIDLNEFLNLIDDIVEENQKDIVSRCFELACVPGETMISKRALLEKVLPAGRLSQRQALVLLDHFPVQPVVKRTASLPPLDAEDALTPPIIRIHQLKTHAAHLDRHLEECATGPIMNRVQFEVTFEQSPFLVVAFFDVVLNFVANELAKPEWNRARREAGAKRTALELMGTVW